MFGGAAGAGAHLQKQFVPCAPPAAPLLGSTRFWVATLQPGPEDFYDRTWANHVGQRISSESAGIIHSMRRRLQAHATQGTPCCPIFVSPNPCRAEVSGQHPSTAGEPSSASWNA